MRIVERSKIDDSRNAQSLTPTLSQRERERERTAELAIANPGKINRWLRKAVRDLDDEAAYIAAIDEAAARSVVWRVLDAVAMLAEQPGLGRPGRIAGTRELVVLKTRYLGSVPRHGRVGRNPSCLSYLPAPAGSLVTARNRYRAGATHLRLVIRR